MHPESWCYWHREDYTAFHSGSQAGQRHQSPRGVQPSLGDGLRYEISDFLSMINAGNGSRFKLTQNESVALADMMEQFLHAEKREKYAICR